MIPYYYPIVLGVLITVYAKILYSFRSALNGKKLEIAWLHKIVNDTNNLEDTYNLLNFCGREICLELALINLCYLVLPGYTFLELAIGIFVFRIALVSFMYRFIYDREDSVK